MSNPVKAITRALEPATNAIGRVFSPVEKAVNRAFTLPDMGQGATAATIEGQTAALREANAIAEKTAKDANARLATAAVAPEDSESARRAAEARMRRLQQTTGFTNGTQTFGAAPIGFRLLSGG